MLKILWFILVAFAISLSTIWLLDNNGQVIVTWLDYEVRTTILAAVIVTVFLALMIFAFSYLLARILSIRFPSFSKLFFKKSHVKRLEKMLRRSEKGSDMLAQLLVAIEVKDKKQSQKLQGRLTKLINIPELNNFITGKVAFENHDYRKAEEYFGKLADNENTKLLILKSKFRFALETKDDVKAIAYAKQMLSVKMDDSETATKLLSIYKEKGLWQEAKALIDQQGHKTFSQSLQKRDVPVMNTVLAYENYQNKRYADAIKFAKIALKADSDFLPATEVLLKSWIRRGMVTKASWTIKRMWRRAPHLVLAEIYDFMHRKSSAKSRIKAMKKLADVNEKTHLGEFAVGLVAFRLGHHDVAKEYLRLSLLKQKTQRAYKLLSYIERIYGSSEGAKRYSDKADTVGGDDYYCCQDCGHTTSKWSARCFDCGGHDSLRWDS